MRLPLLGPHDLLDMTRTVTAAVRTLGSVAARADELVPHVEDLVARLDAVLADERAGRLLDRAEQLLADERIGRLLDRLDAALADERIGRLLDRLDAALADERAGPLLDRVDALLSDRRVEAAMRVFRRLDETLNADRSRSFQVLLDNLPVLFSAERTVKLAALADQAPRMVNGLENGDLPTSRELRQVPPDLHAMLELLDELHQVVTGMPGAGRARERGDDPHPQV